MKHLTTIGRILFALPFGILGINHFIMYDFYSMIKISVFPGGGYTILLAGIALIAASISIMLKKFIPLASLILAGLLLLIILTIHIPGLFDESTFKTALIELFKDTALMGGALMISGMASKEKTQKPQ